MNGRIGWALISFGLAGSVLTACSSSSSPSGSGGTSSHPKSASSSATTNSGPPLGMIAVGHSELTGYASDPNDLGSDELQNSWATGANPAVDSIYQRLVKVEPTMSNEVANTAIDGSKVGALAGEITQALKSEPNPQLVVIQTIDNDIETCDPIAAARSATQFGNTLLQALHLIAHAAPKTTILTMAQFGRPAEAVAALKTIPEVVARSSGTGSCDLFDPAGHVVASHVAALTRTVELYESQESTACGQVAQCHYSDVSARYIDRVRFLADGDWNHQSVAGDAAWAALMWPTVAKLLGVPAN
jgi:hypothetical protein